MINQKYFSGEPFSGSLLYGNSETGHSPGYGLGLGFEEIPEMPLDALEGPQFDYYS